MGVSAPCEICGRADVEHTCSRCAQLVCDEHFSRELGLCVECAADVGQSGGSDGDREGDRPDGVDTYRY